MELISSWEKRANPAPSVREICDKFPMNFDLNVYSFTLSPVGVVHFEFLKACCPLNQYLFPLLFL